MSHNDRNSHYGNQSHVDIYGNQSHLDMSGSKVNDGPVFGMFKEIKKDK